MEYAWVLYIVAAVMFLVGLLIIIFGSRKKKRCSLPLTATIVDVQRDVGQSESGKKETSYSPIYEYDYNGKTYRKSSSFASSSPRRFKVGETVQIKINPDKPTVFWEKGSKSGYFSAVVLMLIAIAIVVVMIIFNK